MKRKSITMINNMFSLTGVVVATYNEKLDNDLQLFELEIEKANYETVIIPVMFGSFTRGNFKKGDKVVVDGSIDLIDKKVCCVASLITNLLEWKKNQNSII